MNRNTVKLCYSCAPNVARIIKSINSKILCHDSATSDAKECNCIDKNSCPLQKKCLTKSVVYEATLTTATQEKFKYLCLTEGTFKERYNMHKSSFRHELDEQYIHSTALSKKCGFYTMSRKTTPSAEGLQQRATQLNVETKTAIFV